MIRHVVQTGVISPSLMFERILISLVLPPVVVAIVCGRTIYVLVGQSGMALRMHLVVVPEPEPTALVLDRIRTPSTHAASRIIGDMRLRARPHRCTIPAALMIMVIIQTLRRRFLHRSPVVASAVLKIHEGAWLVVAEAAVGGTADESLAGVAGCVHWLVGGGGLVRRAAV